MCTACLVFLVCVAVGGLALLTGSATLPGIFTASSGQLNGAAYLDFRPHSSGMMAVIVAGALLGGLLAWRRPARPRGQRAGGTIR